MAERFDIDFETGDLTQFDSVATGTLASIDASIDAVKTGVYGMRCIGAGNGYGAIEISDSADDVYYGFNLFIDPDFTMGAFSLMDLLKVILNDFSTALHFGLSRVDGSSGAPIAWAIQDAAGTSYSSTNLTLNAWHWIECHIVCNSGTVAGFEIWVDDTQIYSDLTQSYTQTAVLQEQLGLPQGDIFEAGDYLYFDNFISDDSQRIPEPTDIVTIVPDDIIQGAPIFGEPILSAALTIVPDDIVQGVPIFGEPTLSGNVLEFSYDDINAGFSGYFNFVDNPNERKFAANACWFGTITGTEARLKCGGGTSPYIVYVDSVDSNPTIAGGEIVLFTGETDTEHNVVIISKPGSVDNFNYITVGELDTLTVKGSSPAQLPLPIDYSTAPSFKGQNTESTKEITNLDLTPTYPESEAWDYERGQLIVDVECDELWVFTNDSGCYLSIDGGGAALTTFTEQDTITGTQVRRSVMVATGLDDTQSHQYTIWGAEATKLGIQGITAKKDGFPVAITQTPLKETARQDGDSITYGEEATPGQVDCWGYAKSIGIAMTKAGFSGLTTLGLNADIPDLMSANGFPDWVIVAIGRNDYGSGTFEADYTTLLNTYLAQAVIYGKTAQIICRGVTPNNSSDAEIIRLNALISDVVDAFANPNIYYINTNAYIPIQAPDTVHPDEVGYPQLETFETPDIRAIITPMIPNDIVQGSPVFGEPILSAELLIVPDGIVQGAPIFGEPILSSDSVIIGKVNIIMNLKDQKISMELE